MSIRVPPLGDAKSTKETLLLGELTVTTILGRKRRNSRIRIKVSHINTLGYSHRRQKNNKGSFLASQRPNQLHNSMHPAQGRITIKLNCTEWALQGATALWNIIRCLMYNTTQQNAWLETPQDTSSRDSPFL